MVASQLFAAFSVTLRPLDSFTVRLAGRTPSWFSLSSHSLRTVAETVSGVCVLVSVVTAPFVAFPVSL